MDAEIQKRWAGPEQAVSLLKRKIRPTWLWAFQATFFSGLLIHLYRMANYIMVDDTPYFSYNVQNTSYFGRWLLQYAGAISSYMELPALNALLSLFYLGIFAAILVELAGVTSRLFCWLLGLTLAALPAFTTTLMFGYAADAYMLALILSGAAALLVCRMKGWKGVALGALCLMLSMAIYQCYLDVTVFLCLLVILLGGLFEKRPWREQLAQAGRMLLMGVLGVVAYMLSAKAALAVMDLAASDYGGFDTMGQLDLAASLDALYQLYLAPRHIFMDKFCYATNLGWQLAGWAALGLMGLMTLWVIWRRKLWQNKLPLALALLSLAAMPAGCSVLAVLQPQNFPYNSLNGFANGLFLVVLPILAARLAQVEGSQELVGKALRWLSLAVCCLLCWHFILLANQAYRVSRVITERDHANANRVLARMEITEGYDLDGPVYFGGVWVPVKDLTDFMQQGLLLHQNIRGLHTDTLLFGDGAYHIYLNENFGTNFQTVDEETKQAIQNSPEYQAMKPWPDASAVGQIQGVLVVKLAE